MIKRPCGSMGCGRLVIPPIRYCDQHQDLERARKAREVAATAKRWDSHHEAHPEWQLDASRWRKVRAAHLKANPYCAMCPDNATTVDHITPHRGDEGIAYDPGNLQSLCKRCHAIKTRADRG